MTGHDVLTERSRDDGWHRLHPASLLFRFGALTKALLIPGLIILGAVLLGRDGDDAESTWQLWAMMLFAPAVLFELFRYMTLRYRFRDDELVIRQGLVFRNERHIPYRRLQNIDLQQNPLHRVLGVANVKLDTAGGAKAEAELKVLSIEAVDFMRSRVFARHDRGEANTAAPEAPGGSPLALSPAPDMAVDDPRRPVLLLRLSLIELIKLGSISGRGMALVAVLIGLAWEFGFFSKFDFWDWIEEGFENGFGLGLGVWSSIVMGLTALLALQILSIVWTVLRFHDFTLEREGDDLRIRCGLWTRHAATIPRRRIQFLTVRESPFHVLYRRVSIRIETAGGKEGDEKHDSISEKWIVPLLPRNELPRVIDELQPGWSLSDIAWHGLAPKATARMVKKALIAGVIVGLLGLIASRPWGALTIFPVCAWFVFLAVREARYLNWATTERGMVFRSGALTRKISIAAYSKLQSLALTASPFDRRYGHARLSADTAGAGPADHRIAVPYLDRNVAERATISLHERTEHSTFRWS